MDRGFDFPKDPVERKVSREQLNNWIETGKGSGVLAYGSSIGLLDTLTKTNTLPSFNAPEYYDKAGITNPFIYLFHPLPSRLDIARPQLLDEMRAKWYEENDESFDEVVSDESMIKTVKRYAQGAAVEDYVWRRLNLAIEYDDVESIVNILNVNEEPEKYLKTYGDPSILQYPWGVASTLKGYVSSREELTKLRRIRSEDQIRLLHDAMKLKGVTLYFHEGIFSKGKARPGVEEADEVVIETDAKLNALDVISGIEFNSEEDRNLYEQLAA